MAETFPSNPADATLTAVRDAVRSRRVSSLEVTEAIMERLETRGRAVNAIAGLYPDAGRADAKAADKVIAAGKTAGVLHGVPLAHKDMFYRPGRPSECGSKLRQGYQPKVLSGALKRLDQAGAIDVARLNMNEFAYGVTGHNDWTGNVTNPWNPAHITGGSSSGSGASVAARANFAALGSDTGGSIRLPAACCGVTGMKVTMGRVSRFGAMPLSHSLDTVGPLTRTVADNALMLSVLAGHDPDDASSARIAVPDYLAGLEMGVAGLRVGLPVSYFRDSLSPEVEQRFEDAIAVFKAAGAVIVDIPMPASIRFTNSLTSLIIATEGAALHQKWLQTRANDYCRQTIGRLAGGLLTPATRYLQALDLRRTLLAEFAELVFRRVDILLTPMLPMPVPTIVATDVGARPEAAEVLAGIGHCSRPVNFLGLPGLSLPAGFTQSGLPASIQLVGRPYDEALLYQAGCAYERETDWPSRAPDMAWMEPAA
ncbi:MAG: amidase [Proteobacteria bacterium]|nr:amidase [Pseudomonadota bacterium]